MIASSVFLGRSALLVGADVGDPVRTRVVGAIIGVLVLLGSALLLVARWVYRSTRPDPEALGPLEVMGGRGWRRLDQVHRQLRLDQVRAVESSYEPDPVVDPAPSSVVDDLGADPGFPSLPGEPMVLRRSAVTGGVQRSAGAEPG